MVSVLSSIMAIAVIVFGAAFAPLIDHSSGPGDESADLLGVIADLDSAVIYDDRAFQNARVLPNEFDELGDSHRIEVDMLFLHDF